MIRSRYLSTGLLIGLSLALAACVSPSVKELAHPFKTTTFGTLFDSDQLSPESRAILEEEGIEDAFEDQPESAITALRERLDAGGSGAIRTVLYELCAKSGKRFAASEPQRAIGFYLVAADTAVGVLEAPATDRDHREALAIYNESCAKVAHTLAESGIEWTGGLKAGDPAWGYSLRIRTSGKGVVVPAMFDSLLPADYLEFKDVGLERIRVEGWGGALVAQVEPTDQRRKEDPFLGPVGRSLPVNATLEFAGKGGGIELVLRNLTVVDSARFQGKDYKLSADYTAPLASLYNFVPKHNVGWRGMLHPEQFARRAGMFLLQPYQRDKIPVVFIHGLMSSPQTWAVAMNSFAGDPVLRERYQVLVYYYPTGFPIAYSAESLRASLKQFRETYDGSGSNPNMRKMVVIGHSMGGLLTSAQIRESGVELEQKFFTEPISEIGGISNAERDVIKKLLVFEANPDISRAVFVAAPHRGSTIASNPIGRLGSKLIRLPTAFLTGQRFVVPTGLTPLGRKIFANPPDGIEGLEPHAPGLTAMLDQPVAEWIEVHSIIGNKRPETPLVDSSDGVVPYWSAHLEDVHSESDIHATHTTITGNDDALEEIRRILYLHLDLPEPESR